MGTQHLDGHIEDFQWVVAELWPDHHEKAQLPQGQYQKENQSQPFLIFLRQPFHQTVQQHQGSAEQQPKGQNKQSLHRRVV